ncbi:ABC transporter permease [Neptunicoccus cionae]|uniref:Glycine/betaine ABC transporter permease n=1 Tax=Neptunicoccus cionae TaxID=2035344 RepID=A0A916QPI8_9RHOB|nr:ABC transporter permease subunit [Amylibacter cionae]GGA05802.1 glycine/betaine ABC transporter permease [Amylibacter cionae]
MSGLSPLTTALDSKGKQAAALVVFVGLLCLLAAPYAPWLVAWPSVLTVPMSEWISQGLGAFFDLIKPAMRWVSWVLGFGMAAANWLLVSTPWVVVIGMTTAVGWYLGGLKMAALGFFGLLFVLASGYWVESMNTLALVFVSVPLALLLGTAIGILAYEVARVKKAVEAVLDLMQTIPTFAYLTPLLLLFGFGPVVGLIASAIYAAPPMARNVLLGLERVESEIKEAAVMSGGTRAQQLFLVELPSAMTQIMVGVNQSLMAALSMVIIAAVIGGFNDIGWEVLLTMRKAQFGQSFLAGLVIVVFAIVIDRMSGALAQERRRYSTRVVWWIIVASLVAAVVLRDILPDAGTLSYFGGVADAVDQSVGDFTRVYGTTLDTVKNTAMFYVLLPLRIGLDDAVLPFTWGFQWTAAMSAWVYAIGVTLAAVLAWQGRLTLGLCLLLLIGVIETGVTQLPWIFVLVGVGALGWVSSGWRLSVLCVGLLGLILISGLWDRALLSLYLSGAAVFTCAVLGGALGLWAAVSRTAWAVIHPVCDMLQTIPLFVFLIPMLMFFQIGEFSAFLAIIAYAIVPMIRYTRHGLVTTPEDMIEAATSSGATNWQIMREVRAPYAAPTILLGLNQTILYAFAMLVIAALIGTTGLGQSIYIALGRADVGLGITAGAAMAILALVADRLVQGFAEERRKALGL